MTSAYGVQPKHFLYKAIGYWGNGIVSLTVQSKIVVQKKCPGAMLERWSVLFFLILFSSVVQAQKDVVFGLSQEYDWGVQTDIAINNNGDVVEVHKTNHPWPELQSLWFRTGKVQQMAIVWNGDSEKYDKGIQPSVALNDYGTIVEIHQSDNPAHKTIWYRVGNLSNGESKDKGKGITPSIAIDNSNWCVEVHQSQQKGNNGLWYSVGNVNGDKIEWGEDRADASNSERFFPVLIG